MQMPSTLLRVDVSYLSCNFRLIILINFKSLKNKCVFTHVDLHANYIAFDTSRESILKMNSNKTHCKI